MTPSSSNLADALTEQASQRPDSTAVLWPGGSLDFRRLDILVWRVAAHLHGRGVREGDVVALTFANEVTLLVAMLAVARLGATVFSVPAATGPLHAAQMTGEAKARVLATDLPDPPAAGEASLPRLQVDLPAIARSSAPVDRSIRVAAPAAPWLLISGSGSTGRSKLIPSTHAQGNTLMRIENAAHPLPEDACIVSLPHLDFASAKRNVLRVLLHGGCVVLFERGRTDVHALCRQHDVTIMLATVSHIEKMLEALPPDARNLLPTLKMLFLTSSTVTDSLRRRIVHQLTPNLYVRYGTNEIGLISLATPAQVISTPGSIGIPLPDVTVEIVDPQGRPLPAGEAGLLRARSPGTFEGYLGDDEANRRAFADGWFLPGDLAKFTDDGQLIYCGRADHMMIMDGINIYPAEIERVACEHPAVRDAAAVPVTSEIHQDIPVCAVALHEGARASLAELGEFVAARLGARSPRRIVLLDRIPRNELGKLIRPQLMQALQALQAAQSATAASPPAAAARPLRQRTRRIRLALELADGIDPAVLDDWLAQALELPAPAQTAPTPAAPATPAAAPDGDPRQAAAREVMRRCLRLTGALLRAAQVPAFDDGEVLEITTAAEPSPGWQTIVTLPEVANLDDRCYALALKGAVQLASWMARQPRTPSSTGLLHANIERLTALLQPMVSTGKSTIPLLRTAWQRNIPFAHLGGGIYQLGWGSRAIRTDRSSTELDAALGSKLAQNKQWAASLVNAAGLPGPRHHLVRSRDEALAAAARLGWPVVVKPNDLDAGKGVTVAIDGPQALAVAFDQAHELSPRKQVLVEREVAGVCHRLFVARGRLLYAVKRLPKSVQGDGTSTVAELIARANRQEQARPPWLRTEPYPLDDDAREAIARAGFDEQSVPAAGALVPLRRIESTRWGGFDEDVTGRIHPDNLDIALRAARLFRLSVAGVDIITTDIGRPWHETGAIVNEVNFAPLLGGGAISRSHIPEFLARFVEGDGRIPVEAVIGDEPDLAAALARQRALNAAGLRCFVTSHERTFTDAGTPLHLPFEGLARRCEALLLDERVDALVLAVGTDEPLHTGLPVDRLSRVERASGRLRSARARGEPAPEDAPERVEALLGALVENAGEAPARG